MVIVDKSFVVGARENYFFDNMLVVVNAAPHVIGNLVLLQILKYASSIKTSTATTIKIFEGCKNSIPV